MVASMCTSDTLLALAWLSCYVRQQDVFKYVFKYVEKPLDTLNMTASNSCFMRTACYDFHLSLLILSSFPWSPQGRRPVGTSLEIEVGSMLAKRFVHFVQCVLTPSCMLCICNSAMISLFLFLIILVTIVRNSISTICSLAPFCVYLFSGS